MTEVEPESFRVLKGKRIKELYFKENQIKELIFCTVGMVVYASPILNIW